MDLGTTTHSEELLADIRDRRQAIVDQEIALVFGSGVISLGGEGVESHRMTIARRVVDAVGLESSAVPAVHGWAAYVEDRALLWSGTPPTDRRPLADEVDHCCRALGVLVGL